MLKWFGGIKLRKLVVIVPLIVATIVPLYPSLTKQGTAAAFSIKTGYYVGSGATKSITGLGFQPQFILLKQMNSFGAGGLIKTKDMTGSTVAHAGAAANATGVTIDSDGFTLTGSTTANVAGDYIIYTAIAGSDCTAGGSVCIGSYSGDGTGAKTLSTGFQPSLVINKSSAAVGGHFKTASMPSTNSEFFHLLTANTNSSYIGALSSSGFSIGTQDNLTGSTYYYAAFKADSSKMSEGTYTGDGTDNRNLSVTGYKPSMVMIKNSSLARRAVWTAPEAQGDHSLYIGDNSPAGPNIIQALNADGFQLGNSAVTNESGATFYWFSFGGATSATNAAGSFKMAVGSYTGTGAVQSISELGFKPNLIFATNAAVLKTSVMPVDLTFYNGNGGADFSGGITSLDSDGFGLGTNAAVNSSGATYYWQAFGGAYNPDTSSGAVDFAVGAINGNGLDNRDINGLPFQPDLIIARKAATGTTSFRTSSHSGDSASSLATTSDGANLIQAFSSDGFQLGNPSTLNVSNNVTYWIAFKEGANLSIDGYTGNSVVDREITSPGFQPDLVWVKHTSTQTAVQRSSAMSGDSSQVFTAAANLSGRIKSFTPNGFTLGNTGVNGSGANYRYIAWKIPASGSLGVGVVDSGGTAVGSPSFNMNTLGFQFDCASTSGSLGVNSQRIRVSNTTSSPAWTLSIAATDGAAALWANAGNTKNYDFNDTTSSGCVDGADGDSNAGRMSIDASVGTLSPQAGCSSSNISQGAGSSFDEGITDSITLISASASADTDCYWDLTDAAIEQAIPAQQASDSYNINLTVTITAS